MRILKMLAVLVIGLSIVGCSTKSSNLTNRSSNVNHEALENAPQWIITQSIEGKVAAVGSARLIGNDVSWQITNAKANAKDALVRKIQEKIFTALKTTATGKENSVFRTSKVVSKHISNSVLFNTEVEKMFIDENGIMYVLVSVSSDSIRKTLSTFTDVDKIDWN